MMGITLILWITHPKGRIHAQAELCVISHRLFPSKQTQSNPPADHPMQEAPRTSPKDSAGAGTHSALVKICSAVTDHSPSATSHHHTAHTGCASSPQVSRARLEHPGTVVSVPAYGRNGTEGLGGPFQPKSSWDSVTAALCTVPGGKEPRAQGAVVRLMSKCPEQFCSCREVTHALLAARKITARGFYSKPAPTEPAGGSQRVTAPH